MANPLLKTIALLSHDIRDFAALAEIGITRHVNHDYIDIRDPGVCTLIDKVKRALAH